MPARLARASCLADLLANATAFLAGHGVPSPRLDAEVLLAHVMGGSRTELYLHDSPAPHQHQRDAFWHTLKRRARREPVAYITGVQEFWSLEFTVHRHVLIPRPETERVVELALELLGSCPTPRRILDLGTGSGCIAVTLASQLPQARVWACDVSAEALEVARTNAVAHGLAERMTFVQADMRHGLPQAAAPTFDLIVSNPPYVAGPEFAALQAEVAAAVVGPDVPIGADVDAGRRAPLPPVGQLAPFLEDAGRGIGQRLRGGVGDHRREELREVAFRLRAESSRAQDGYREADDKRDGQPVQLRHASTFLRNPM